MIPLPWKFVFIRIATVIQPWPIWSKNMTASTLQMAFHTFFNRLEMHVSMASVKWWHFKRANLRFLGWRRHLRKCACLESRGLAMQPREVARMSQECPINSHTKTNHVPWTSAFSVSFLFFCIVCFILLVGWFLGPHLQHMEAPKLGVESEL